MSDSQPMPLVSIGIITHNRVEDLLATLDAVSRGLTYPRTEIVVVDNGSSDSTDELVSRHFPTVRLHRLETNEGIAARNRFLELSKGEYILSLDDDSFPLTPDFIEKAISHLERYPEAAAVSANCYRPREGRYETAEWFSFASSTVSPSTVAGPFIVEGAVLWRRTALESLEGYDAFFHWGVEGTELAIGGIRKGYAFHLSRDLEVLHLASSANRSQQRTKYYNCRNSILLFRKHFPSSMLPALVTAFLLRKGVGAVRRPALTAATLRGIWSGLRDMRVYKDTSSRLSWHQVRALRRGILHLYRW